MKTFAIDLSNQIFTNPPQKVLEDVLNPVDSTIAPKPYVLSKEQQDILDNQIIIDKNLYTDAKKVYNDLKVKYGL